MATAPDENGTVRPTKIGEVLRLAHALMYPGTLSGDSYVVMSTKGPMHWIAGVYPDNPRAKKAGDDEDLPLDQKLVGLAAAKARLAQLGQAYDPKLRNRNPYDPEGAADSFLIYRVENTFGVANQEDIDVCLHDCYTEWDCPPFRNPEKLKVNEVQGWRLTVFLNKLGKANHPNWRDGSKFVEFGPTIDAVSLRVTALRRFIFPQYESSLGLDYRETLEKRMRGDHHPLDQDTPAYKHTHPKNA